MKSARSIVCLILAFALFACPSSETAERDARRDLEAALARGDQREALAALERLREAQFDPDTAEAINEYALLLVQAGEAAQAVWVLEDAIARLDDELLRVTLGSVLILANDPTRAIAVLDEVPGDSPLAPRTLLLRSQAQLKLGDADSAYATLERLERDFSDEPGVRVPRVAALLKGGRLEEASAALLEARSVASGEAELNALRRLEASVLLEEATSGDVEAPAERIRQLVEEAPEDAELWRMWVQLLSRERRHEEAGAAISEALAEDADNLPLYGLLASVQTALGRHEESVATVRRWIERSPSASAYIALGQLHSSNGESARALDVYEEALAMEFGPEAEKLLLASRVEVLIELERFEEAEAGIEVLEEADGDPRVTGLLVARVELGRGDYEAARERLEALVPVRDDAAAQFWLGRALEASGDLVGAESRYARAAILSPIDPTPAAEAFRVASQRSRWDIALSHARTVLTRAPGHPDGWRAMARAWIELGEGEKAEEIVELALKAFPDDATLHALYAGALRIQGRHEEAYAAVQAGLEHDPGSIELATERALALASGGRIEESLASLDEDLAREPDSAELQFTLASVLYAAGRAAEGDAATDRALELAPLDLRPLRRRLEFRAATGRLEAALADADRYLEAQPADSGAHFILGVVHERLGHEAEAIATYRAAIRLDSTAVAPRNNLAVLLGRRGELDDALAVGQEAYRLAPENPHVLDTLGTLYLQRGLVDRAISILEDARALSPDQPDAQLHLALAYREAGRTDEARTLLAALRPNAPAAMRPEVEEALATLR